MGDYKYKLQYTNGEEVITHEFPADIDGWHLAIMLRDFLCGCSWSDEQVKSIINLDEEED